jgi:hypothetical protein
MLLILQWLPYSNLAFAIQHPFWGGVSTHIRCEAAWVYFDGQQGVRFEMAQQNTLCASCKRRGQAKLPVGWRVMPFLPDGRSIDQGGKAGSPLNVLHLSSKPSLRAAH